MTQALCRPIEITTANKDFTITLAGDALKTCALSLGVYASILTLLHEMEVKIRAHGGNYADVQVYLDSTWHVVVWDTSVDEYAVDLIFTDTALGRLLGWRSNHGAELLALANDTPQYVWLPTYEASDNGAWSNEWTFAGENSVTGSLAGVALSPDRYERGYQWPAEVSTNVYRSRATAEYVWGATTYYPQDERCLEAFVRGAQTAAIVESTADGISPKGFYIVHDRSVYTGIAAVLPATMTSGGLKTELTGTPDKFVFCQLQSDPGLRRSRSVDATLAWIDVGLNVHTSTAPTWSAP